MLACDANQIDKTLIENWINGLGPGNSALGKGFAWGSEGIGLLSVLVSCFLPLLRSASISKMGSLYM